MTTKQKAGQNLIRVKNSTLVLTTGNEEISLPRLGYIPRNDDTLNIYNSDGETSYSFESTDGKLQAIYTQNPDGSMIFKRAGKDEMHISKESLAEMRKNNLGSWQKDFDLDKERSVAEYVPDLSMKDYMKLLAGSLAIGVVEPTTGFIGTGIAVYGCGNRLLKENTAERKMPISKINDMRNAKSLAGGR